MTHECFRQQSTSSIWVAGKDRSDAGERAARAVIALQDGLATGRSIHVSQSATEPLRCVGLDEIDGCQVLLVESSGSTGAPKTVRRRPASWIRSFEVNAKQFGLSAQTPYAVLGDLGSSLTLYAVVEALHLQADVAILTGLSPRAQHRSLIDAQSVVLYATPTQLRLLTKVGPESLSALRYVFSGGGKLDLETRNALRTHAPNADVIEFFGASETSFMTISNARSSVESVGQAYPGVELQIRDAQMRPTDGAGEIWVKSPYLFDGYATGNSADTRWCDGFLSIGEMGKLDRDGNLTLLGRRNRMVTIADQNVYPEVVEAQMMRDPLVTNCVVLPIHDALRGQVIVGVLEGREDAALALRLQRQCREALGPHATPRRLLFMDRLPLLPAGKPDLQRLIHMIGELA